MREAGWIGRWALSLGGEVFKVESVCKEYYRGFGLHGQVVRTAAPTFLRQQDHLFMEENYVETEQTGSAGAGD